MSKDQNNRQQQAEKYLAHNSFKLVKSIVNTCHGIWLEFQAGNLPYAATGKKPVDLCLL